MKEFCNKGIGTKTLIWREEIAKSNNGISIETWVSDMNESSFRRLIKLKYKKTDTFTIRDVILAGGKQKFYKWIKDLKSV